MSLARKAFSRYAVHVTCAYCQRKTSQKKEESLKKLSLFQSVHELIMSAYLQLVSHILAPLL
jgi:hypothetical protein